MDIASRVFENEPVEGVLGGGVVAAIRLAAGLQMASGCLQGESGVADRSTCSGAHGVWLKDT